MEKNKDHTSRGRAQDRHRVAASQEWELNYMKEKFNVSTEQVQEAVNKVGNSREKVEEYLKDKSSVKT